MRRCELDSQTRFDGCPTAGNDPSVLGSVVKAPGLSSQEIAGSTPAGRDACRCGTNWIYAVVRNGKVRRLTFSRALAEFILTKNSGHQIVMLDLVPGRDTQIGDVGIFGIVDNRKGKLLRATVSFEEAQFLTQDETRRVVLCGIRGQRPHA